MWVVSWDDLRAAFAPTPSGFVVDDGPPLLGDAEASFLPCVSPIQGLAWSADGRWLAVASGGTILGADGTVRVADPTVGRTLFLRGHGRGTHHAAFDPTSGRLATAGHDGVVGLWDLAGRRGFPIPGPTPRHRVAFARSGAWLVIGDELPAPGAASAVTVLDLEAARTLLVRAVPADHLVEALALSPDGRRIVVHLFGRGGGHVFECRTFPEWEPLWSAPLPGHAFLNGLAWPSAGTVVRAISDPRHDRWLEVLDAATGGVRARRAIGHTLLGGMDVDVTRDRIATIGREGTLGLWRLSDLEAIGEGHLGDWPATRVALSPDGVRVAVGSARDQGVRILSLP